MEAMKRTVKTQLEKRTRSAGILLFFNYIILIKSVKNSIHFINRNSLLKNSILIISYPFSEKLGVISAISEKELQKLPNIVTIGYVNFF